MTELETELRSSVDPLNGENSGEESSDSQNDSRQLVHECGQLRAKLQQAQETNARLELQVVELAQQVAQLQERPSDVVSEVEEKKTQQPCSSCASLEVQLTMLKRQLEEQRQRKTSTEEKFIAEDVQDNAETRRAVRFSDMADYTIHIENNTQSDTCQLDANSNR